MFILLQLLAGYSFCSPPCFVLNCLFFNCYFAFLYHCINILLWGEPFCWLSFFPQLFNSWGPLVERLVVTPGGGISLLVWCVGQPWFEGVCFSRVIWMTPGIPRSSFTQVSIGKPQLWSGLLIFLGGVVWLPVVKVLLSLDLLFPTRMPHLLCRDRRWLAKAVSGCQSCRI